jgi:nicotinate phosphoribosyltransferase
MQIFPSRGGVYCGIKQVIELLDSIGFSGEVMSLEEGQTVSAREAAVHIFGTYSSFGIYETAILGILASCTAWATAAREVVESAGGVQVVSFGARHVHPNVAGLMDYAAIVGGCIDCSTPLGAALAGRRPSGTMSHAYILIVGDTVRAARTFDEIMPNDVPRIVLVDTFQDEAIESVRVAEALGKSLQGVRLDTAHERGGVTPELVKEVRARLDLGGFNHVRIAVSGGLNRERVDLFRQAEAPVDSFGVGAFISGATPIDYTADIREIAGKPVAKLGRIPGMSSNPRLRRVL